MENIEQVNIVSDETMTVLRKQLGEILMHERLSQKKEVVDVARRLMLSKQQLLAIESGESASFHHERRYIQGTKSYVFYLGLQNRIDVESFLKQIEESLAVELRVSPAAGVAQLHRAAAAPVDIKSFSVRPSGYVYAGLAVLLVGAIAVALSEGWPFENNNDESILDASTLPPAVASATNSATTSAITNATINTRTDSPIISSGTTSFVRPEPSVQAVESALTAESTKGVGQSQSTDKSLVTVVSSRSTVMRIDFRSECWLSIVTTEGKKIDRVYKQGEKFSIPLENISTMILGNVPAAQIFFGDQSIDLIAQGLAKGNVARLDQKSLQLLQKN